MSNRFFLSFFVLWLLSFNVVAKNSDDPFAKNESIDIGKDISWKIDKKSVLATKSASDKKGNYYHLQFDNKQLKLIISSDAKGDVAKKFSQLEIKDVKIDGKQSRLFKWCLNNQQRHSRFLQQGLTVKKNVCSIDANTGSFVMRLNKETLLSLQNGKRLSIKLSPFRTSLHLNYDITDFKDMNLTLSAKAAPVAAMVPSKPVAKKTNKKCRAGPPAKYNSIRPVEYNCDDNAAKKDAETRVAKLVKQEKAKKQKLAAKGKQQRKLVKEKKRKAKLKQEKKSQMEAAAIAASEVKQAELNNEITQKMLKVCEKYWRKGEHRCYCQKYIKYAPSAIKASSTCEQQ